MYLAALTTGQTGAAILAIALVVMAVGLKILSMNSPRAKQRREFEKERRQKRAASKKES